jgi:hypothetical protein
VSTRIERIQNAVEKMHGGRATHSKSVPVNEVFQGKTVWEGVVEIFDLEFHPKANRCYAWEIPGENPDYVAVLEIPPVDSPVTAVRAAVVSQSKRPGA